MCQCDNGSTYAQLKQGTTPASIFNPCSFTAYPQTTAASNPSECEFDGPADCSAATELNVQSIIEQAQQNYAAQELANCSDLTYHISDPGPVALSNGDTCADVLNITLHMAWWWSQYGDTCTKNDVGFANCFYDMVPHYNASNCSDLSGNAYCPKPNYNDFTNADNRTLDFYVAWNIYNFQQWSYMYYTAMFDGGFLAGSQVWNTTVAFEHLHGVDVKLEVMLGILTFALGLISPSGWANKLPTDAASAKVDSSFIFANQVPGEYLLRAAQQSPSFAHNLLPTGNIDDATMASDEIQAQLGEYIAALAGVIQDVSVNVPDNLTAFAGWLGTGYFFNEPPALNDMTSSIRIALNTYVLSQILQDNNIFIARQIDTDPHQLQTNATGKEISIDLGCKDGYNNYSICGQWWFDSVDNIAYSLYSESDYWASYIDDLQAVFDEGLTTPELVFLGSQYCALGANASQGAGPEQSLASNDGAVSTACLSNMAVCTWNLADEWPEFYESTCHQDSNYDLPDCAADATDVPLGYLGYWLFNGATCESEEGI